MASDFARTAFGLFFFLAAFACTPALCLPQTEQARIPRELVGTWGTQEHGGACLLEIEPEGFEGSTDGESYICDLDEVLVARKDSVWVGQFFCHGEWGEAELSSVLTLNPSGKELTLRNHPSGGNLAVGAEEVYFRCSQ